MIQRVIMWNLNILGKRNLEFHKETRDWTYWNRVWAGENLKRGI